MLGDLIATDSNIASNGVDSLNLLDLPTQPTNLNNLAPTVNSGKSSNIFDLLGTLDLGGENVSTANNINNLLDGLSSQSSVMPSNNSNLTTTFNDAVHTSPTLANIALDSKTGIFGSMPSAEGSDTIPSLTAYEKNGVKIVFDFVKREEKGQTTINLTASCHSTSITDFQVQVAVPKSMRIILEPASGDKMPPVIHQVLRLENSTNAVLKMRLKVQFKSAVGDVIDDLVPLTQFPSELNN